MERRGTMATHPRALTLFHVAALLAFSVSRVQCGGGSVIGSPFSLSQYDNSAVLKANQVLLYWTVDSSSQCIHVALHARTAGWVALGISEVGAMVGSDVMLGWVAEGRAFLTDRFIFNKSLDAAGVAIDASQDVRIVGGGEAVNASTGDTWTTLHFWRPLNATDCNDRQISQGQHVALIWAMGSTDKVSYHGANKGGASLVLYPGAPFALLGPQPEIGPSTMANSATPGRKAQETVGPAPRVVHHRSLQRTPRNQTASSNLLEVTKNFNMVQWLGRAPVKGAATHGRRLEATASAAHASLSSSLFTEEKAELAGEAVHRRSAMEAATGNPGAAFAAPAVQTDEWLNMTAKEYTVPPSDTTYACNAFTLGYKEKKHAVEVGVIVNTTNPELLHHMVVFACDNEDRPSDVPNYECFDSGGCSLAFSVWAMGGKPMTIPAAAGLPLGPTAYTTFVLQIHYSNPGGVSGVKDSSGMYFKMAPTLREFDAGLLELGASDFTNMISIPPKQPAWTQDTYCPQECTQHIADNNVTLGNNITVFASTMHQHAAGKQVFTDVYRGGKKVATIGRQDYFDFTFQQFQDLSPGLWILPGDEIKTRCVWQTTDRANVTKGGYSGMDEMCTNYVFYYPARLSFVGQCYNFCLFAEKGYELGATPKVNCTLTPQGCIWQPYTKCSNTVYERLRNATCPNPIEEYYGAPGAPFDTAAGCPSKSAAEGSVDMSSLSVPVTRDLAVPKSSAPEFSLRVRGITALFLAFALLWS